MTDRPVERPLRSLLFAPGNEPRKVEKVAIFGADAVILDLEDAVPDADKVTTRDVVRNALPAIGSRGLVCVRVNGLTTGLAAGDVSGVTAPGLDAIVLPKTEGAEDIIALHSLLDRAESRAGVAAGHVKILPLVETARGISRGIEIAGASPRVLTLLFGSGDFTRDLELPSVRWSADGLELLYARTRFVVDSRAAGRARPIDGPYLAVRDAAGFEADYRVATKIGFQGKLCIHPAQVAAANRIFAPDPDEVAFCRRVVADFRGGGGARLGVHHRGRRLRGLPDRGEGQAHRRAGRGTGGRGWRACLD